MSVNKVKDPPHLGFCKSVIKISSKQNDKLGLVLKQLERKLNLYTSTPNAASKSVSIMDISFSKYYQNVTSQVDNDSGYVSQNQESNSELFLEGFSESGQFVLSESKPMYLCEDALLERPQIKSQPEVLVSPSGDIKMYGSTDRIEASVSTVSEHFSVLRGSIESNTSTASQVSTVISEINPIIIPEDCTNCEEICDTSNDSNIENNKNFLNISNNVKASFAEDSNTYNDSKCLNYEIKNNSFYGSNDSLINKSYEQIGNSTSTNISGPMSPELFSDEDVRDTKYEKQKDSQSFIYKEKYVLQQDEKLIKNVQNTLSGVLPPPSLTTIHLTVEQMLENINTNKHLFWTECKSDDSSKKCDNGNNISNTTEEIQSSLLLTTNDNQCIEKPWPHILEDRYHGLHYNRSKLSEDFELMCMKYAERYIGCETQSTCTVFQQPFLSSPLKRKANKLRWAIKSPGRRLSHLARRRITFSSASLQASSASGSGLNAHTRQVVMDSRRFQLLSRKRSPLKKSPKKTPRKTPRKSPQKKIRTPSSSAKKRLSLQLQSMSRKEIVSGLSTTVRASSTKRALFQSPDKLTSSLSKPLFPSTSGASTISPFKKRMTPKCALFSSPSKNSVLMNENKRKRLDSDDLHPSKFGRSVSLQEAAPAGVSIKQGLSRIKSDMSLSTSQYSGELSAHHKKKLQWAVYEALRSQNIGINHPQFKQFASVLARVTKRFLPNLSANAPRPEGGTSDRMLRIARQHIYAVSKGKSVDEIIQDFEINRLKALKPSGYVGIQGHQADISATRNKENIFKDKSNTMSNEKKKLGLNRDELIKTLPKFENRVDRARRIINFDENNSIR